MRKPAQAELEQRPALRRSHVVEQQRQVFADGRLIARLELVDDLVQRRNAVQDGRARISRPDMRHRLRHIAHIIVGERQQLRVHPLRHQIAHQRALERLEAQRAGDRADREAPVRVRRAAQVIGQDRRLGVVRVRVIEAVEEGGEGLHAGNVIILPPRKRPAGRRRPGHRCQNSGLILRCGRVFL